MQPDPITKIDTRLINSVKLEVINTQRKLIQITERDTKSVIQNGFKLLHDNNGRIRTLYDLGIYDKDDFLFQMHEQNRLENKLQQILTNKNGLNRVRIESSPDEN